MMNFKKFIESVDGDNYQSIVTFFGPKWGYLEDILSLTQVMAYRWQIKDWVQTNWYHDLIDYRDINRNIEEKKQKAFAHLLRKETRGKTIQQFNDIPRYTDVIFYGKFNQLCVSPLTDYQGLNNSLPREEMRIKFNDFIKITNEYFVIETYWIEQILNAHKPYCKYIRAVGNEDTIHDAVGTFFDMSLKFLSPEKIAKKRNSEKIYNAMISINRENFIANYCKFIQKKFQMNFDDEIVRNIFWYYLAESINLEMQVGDL